jgi:hypothetical protein
MADEYDIIDFVYGAVKASGTGLRICKGRSETGIEENHIVINHLSLTSDTYDLTNHLPVNVNVFIKRNSNGTSNRELMKETVRTVRESIEENIQSTDGQYRYAKVQWTTPADIKDGFDCMNIRINCETDE